MPPNKRSRPEETSFTGSPTKQLKCHAYDAVVVVGSGRAKQEFPCYRLDLGRSSDYFDTMLGAPMRENATSRIEFPDKNPEEWKVVYTFIDPDTKNGAKVNKDNAEMLLPWFNELLMEDHFNMCDDELATLLIDAKGQSYWSTSPGDKETSSESFKKIFGIMTTQILPIIRLMALPRTTKKTVDEIILILEYSPDIVKDDLENIKQLLALLGEEALRPFLLNGIKTLLPTADSELDMSVIYSGGKDKKKKQQQDSSIDLIARLVRAGIREKQATRAMKRILELPKCLFEEMPNRRSLNQRNDGDTTIAELARGNSKMIVYKQLADNGIVVIPNNWENASFFDP